MTLWRRVERDLTHFKQIISSYQESFDTSLGSVPYVLAMMSKIYM